MIETMFTYINEEYRTNKNILKNRKKNLNDFLELAKNKKYNRWIVLATGSSANAIECAKYYVEELLNINIEIKMPSVFSNYNYNIEKDALYIGVTQGGHSFSTIEALKEANKYNVDTIAITANLNSPICKLSKSVIDIGCDEEKVGYVTKGFSATILTFILMGLELAYEYQIINQLEYEEKLNQIINAINHTDEVIQKTLKWYEANKNELIDAKIILCIGNGPGYGVSKEANTKITETVRVPMSAHEVEEYMHGPYLSLSKDDNIIFIETKSKLQKRQNDLKDYLKDYTNHIYTITYKDFSNNHHDLALGLEIDEMISPLLFTIPIQILSYYLAEDKGNNLSKMIFKDFDDKLKSKIY